MKYLPVLLSLIALGGADPVPVPPSQVIPSTILPPTIEPLIVFTHAGETLAVGQKTGKVTILGGVKPIPPQPPPPKPDDPPRPDDPASNLTALQREIYYAIVTKTPSATRTEGVSALKWAIQTTETQDQSLALDPQGYVNALVQNAQTGRVPELLPGFNLGDLLTKREITTKEQLKEAIKDLLAALGAVK